MLDIRNKNCIASFLEDLKQEQVPQFGKFTPQHMLEHLLFTLEVSIGKKEISLASKDEHLMALRNFLYSDKEIREGAKAPYLGDELPDLNYRNFTTAKEKLLEAIDNFNDYYLKHPTEKNMNPVFGVLDKDEWIRFHNKHFVHHFRQFGLV